jgi:hypothetical protein
MVPMVAALDAFRKRVVFHNNGFAEAIFARNVSLVKSVRAQCNARRRHLVITYWPRWCSARDGGGHSERKPGVAGFGQQLTGCPSANRGPHDPRRRQQAEQGCSLSVDAGSRCRRSGDIGGPVKYGLWASAGVAFGVFLILALGKQYKRYRGFVYRAVMPAGTLILLGTYALDMVLREGLPNPVTRLFFSLAMAVPIGILAVFVPIELYGWARLHWVTALSPGIDENKALTFLRSFYLGLNYPMMMVAGGQVPTTRESGPATL